MSNPDKQQAVLLRTATTRQYLEKWGNDHENRRGYLLPLALRIHEENPTWAAGRVWIEAKQRGCFKMIAEKAPDGSMKMVPNPDYIEPPLDPLQ